MSEPAPVNSWISNLRPAITEVDQITEDDLIQGYKSRFQNFTPTGFEKLLKLIFEEMGYDVDLTPESGDFGADLLLRKDDIVTAVQIKRYFVDHGVSAKHVGEVLVAKYYYCAQKCIFITTSFFTEGAQKAAERSEIELWDWIALSDLLESKFAIISKMCNELRRSAAPNSGYNYQMQSSGPKKLTTVADLPLAVKIKAAISIIGWILVIYFMFKAFWY